MTADHGVAGQKPLPGLVTFYESMCCKTEDMIIYSRPPISDYCYKDKFIAMSKTLIDDRDKSDVGRGREVYREEEEEEWLCHSPNTFLEC